MKDNLKCSMCNKNHETNYSEGGSEREVYTICTACRKLRKGRQVQRANIKAGMIKQTLNEVST